MEAKYFFGAISVLSLALIGGVALYCGVNGTLLTSIVGVITAIIGAILGYQKGLYKPPPVQ